jgi:phosphatidylserine/phosphatidylglycerophosphate/cardiolipin synthase-like enzyme
MPDFIFPQPQIFSVQAVPLLGAYFYDELIKSIDGARKFINAVQYQWKWNIHERFSKVQMLGGSIIRAQKRNVQVSVILNQESPRRNLTKINSITCNYLAREGVRVRMLRTASLLHTKLWIIDGEHCFIGSHNISARSLSVNEEASVKITDNKFSEFMQLYFDNLWGSK